MAQSEEESTSVGADGVKIQHEKPRLIIGTTERGDGEDTMTLVEGLQVGFDCYVVGLSSCRMELFDMSVLSYPYCLICDGMHVA